MLFVYTCHCPPCAHRNIHYRRCRCPKWIRGRVDESRLIRQSARTRSWSEAEEKARELGRKSILIQTAVEAYLNDEQGRKLKPATHKQKSAFLKGDLMPWCTKSGLTCLDQFRLPQVREFRQTWDLAASTAGRRHERLRSFLAFCVSSGWIASNPTDTLKRPVKARTLPTDYFTRRQFRRIISATKEYGYGGGHDCRFRGRRILALVLLMRWSGLAITDAVMLARDRLDASGALFLRRAKTGVPVFVPLPPAITSLLRSLPSPTTYFFWSGNGDPRSAVQGYHRSLRKLFLLAHIRNCGGTPKPCRPHMFRDTFAVEMLLAGVPIDQVSVLLGHRSIKMTEKHYLPWVKARQRQLTTSVRQAWFPEVKDPILVQEEAPTSRISVEATSRMPGSGCHSVEVHGCSNQRGAKPFYLYL